MPPTEDVNDDIELTPAQIAEVERRLARAKAHPEELISWEVVKEMARERAEHHQPDPP